MPGALRTRRILAEQRHCRRPCSRARRRTRCLCAQTLIVRARCRHRRYAAILRTLKRSSFGWKLPRWKPTPRPCWMRRSACAKRERHRPATREFSWRRPAFARRRRIRRFSRRVPRIKSLLARFAGGVARSARGVAAGRHGRNAGSGSVCAVAGGGHSYRLAHRVARWSVDVGSRRFHLQRRRSVARVLSKPRGRELSISRRPHFTCRITWSHHGHFLCSCAFWLDDDRDLAGGSRGRRRSRDLCRWEARSVGRRPGHSLPTPLKPRPGRIGCW